MSYEILRSVNFKTHTFTCASNNVFPKDWYTNQYSLKEEYKNKDINECFVKFILINLLEGNFHLEDKFGRLAYLMDIIEKSNARPLDEKYWFDRTLSNDVKKELSKEIMDKLYKTYLSYKDIKGRYVVEIEPEMYFVRSNPSSFRYVYRPNEAKVFDTISKANACRTYFKNRLGYENAKVVSIF